MKSKFAPIVFGNWKMNSSKKETEEFFHTFKENISTNELEKVRVGFAPSHPLLDKVSSEIENNNLKLLLGAQNIHWAEKGAHTGEVSASMLKECNVNFAIIGHSERRAMYGENNNDCAKRTLTAIQNNIIPVLCIGENESEYRAGSTKEVVLNQLKDSLKDVNLESQNTDFLALVIAYEPVWAIGTGLSAKPEEANEICSLIKQELSHMYKIDIPVLYGGSADDKNALTLIQQESIDGFLVGGASLKPLVFASMINDCAK